VVPLFQLAATQTRGTAHGDTFPAFPAFPAFSTFPVLPKSRWQMFQASAKNINSIDILFLLIYLLNIYQTIGKFKPKNFYKIIQYCFN